MVVSLGGIAPAANAQTAPTSTTATTPPPVTTTIAKPVTTTTTKPTAKATTTTTTTTTTVAATTTTFPPGLLAVSRSVRRSPPSNTVALLAALAPLRQMGYTAQQAEIAGMGQFPVAGPSYYADDWLEPRPGTPPRLHLGDDIVADTGTPIRSPVDGNLKYDTSDPAGYGLDAVVTGADKTFYIMAHMSATVTGLATGDAVKEGQVVGFVGATGDASGPHCHFEIHPQGGAGIDPKATLDAWQKAAVAAAPALIEAVKQSHEPASTAANIPLQVLLPLPQALSSPIPAPMSPLATHDKGSLAGLSLVGLVCLLASGTLAARSRRFRPA
jgi:murein DD-endopeptidase MepM/ murein hydrolase activator NlpD